MSYDNLILSRGMYEENDLSFSDILEMEDPSGCYRGTSLEGLDAYQRQLKRFNINVNGTNSDVVERFFGSMESAVLFPEYVRRAVKQGTGDENIIPAITATITKIKCMDYRSITSGTWGDKALRNVGDSAFIPHTVIKIQENQVKLHKRGRMLVTSYEAIRYQKLDLFSVILRQIGAQISRMHLEDAVDVILNGDGNGNYARSFDVAKKSTFVYADLVDFWSKFDPYELNTMLVSSRTMAKMLKMQEFQNPVPVLNFHDSGIKTTLGAKLLRTNAVPDGKIIGLDKRYALEMVKGSDVMVEYDKLIDRQLERAAITSIAGFAKLYKDSSKILTL